jgi:site-specific DNA-methyltransferase (adenine-specific)
VLTAFAQFGERGAFAPVLGTEPSASTKSVFGQINRQASNAFHGDTGTAARFFYCAKASRKDRDEGLGGFVAAAAGVGDNRPSGGFNERMNKGSVTMRANTHPTVKPTELMRYLVRLVTPLGGCVLDPFAGSGSTGKACALEGFVFIGFELDKNFTDIANARILAAA